jgi:hypothetical protein
MSHFVTIPLTDVPRFNAKPKSLTPRERTAFKQWFAQALRENWIRPSQARHSSRLLFVPKKNGTLRTCIDYRQLNALTKSTIYAPRSDASLRNQISGHSWYTKIDLENAFYFINIDHQDRWKTAFRTPHGLYEFNVLPFGLKNAPGEFQLFIESVLIDILGDNICVHIDDILIHCRERRQCVALTEKVLQRLRDRMIPINDEKTTYNTESVEYCGFRYENGTCTPVGKTETIAGWPTPTCATHVRTFLGMTNHFRGHITQYAKIAQPLYACTGNDWAWAHTQDIAFHTLRNSVRRIISTRHHDPLQPATMITDASLFALGAILEQDGHVTAVWSRSLTPPERNYTANERELLAVVDALKTWTWALEMCPRIDVHTDSQINSQMIRPNDSNRRVNRWILTLQAFQLHWTHIPGLTNPADPISRRPDYRRTSHVAAA